MTTDWLCKHHDDLGKEQLYAILELRSEVFVVEQKCAYQDVDGQDLSGDTLHVMGWQDDKLVAYARLLDPESQGGDVVIGRVIIAPRGRGQKLGHRLLEVALENIEEYWSGHRFSCPRKRTCSHFMSSTGFGPKARRTLKMTSRTSACAGVKGNRAPA